MIVGCCGSGKSTLARELSSILRIDLFHLDQYYWKPNWQETEPKEWENKVTQLASFDSWIIDGNYKGTMEIRLLRADTVIMLNIPTYKCFLRVLKRIFLHWHKVRPDMPPGCKERFDFDFLKYVWNFKRTQGKKLV